MLPGMRMVFVTATLVLLTTAAHANPTSDVEEKAAQDAATAGDFIGAANHYKAAYAADPKPELICNAGVAYYKANDATRAHLYLSRCQERGTALDATFVSAVRGALAAVEAQVRANFTPVDIVARPEGATVVIGSLGESDAFVGSRLVWLPRGKQTITVKAEGYTPKVTELDAQGSERMPVEVTLEKVVVVLPPPGPEEPPPVIQPLPDEPTTPPSKVPAFVAMGGTVAAFVVAGIAYSKAHSAADRASQAVSMDVYNDDKDSASSWNTVMGVSGAVGILGAAASAFFVLRW